MSKIKFCLPEFMAIAAVALVLNLWILFSLFIENREVLGLGYDYVLRFISTGVASLAGAYFAFKLNSTKSKAETETKEAEKVNIALLNIYTQISVVRKVRSDLKNEFVFVEAFFNKLDGFYNTNISIPAEELSPLLVHNPDVVSKLIHSQNLYLQLLDSISKRNDFYTKKIEPSLSNISYPIDLNLVKNAVPQSVHEDAVSWIDIIKTQAEWADKELLLAFNDLRKLAVKIYPKYKFIKLHI